MSQPPPPPQDHRAAAGAVPQPSPVPPAEHAPPGQVPPGAVLPGQVPPGVVPPGQAPPMQLLVAQRIPEDQPFLVRPSVGKRIAQFSLIGVVLALLLACPVAALAADMAAGAGAGPAPLFVAVGLLVLLVAALFGVQVYLLTSGGPVLAVGPHGLWIKTRPTRGQAMWFPWATIARIYRRRWSFEKMVCVQPWDPRVGTGLGTYTAVDSAAQQLFFGSRFVATLNFADRREAEIMGALAHFAAGRCRIE